MKITMIAAAALIGVSGIAVAQTAPAPGQTMPPAGTTTTTPTSPPMQTPPTTTPDSTATGTATHDPMGNTMSPDSSTANGAMTTDTKTGKSKKSKSHKAPKTDSTSPTSNSMTPQ